MKLIKCTYRIITGVMPDILKDKNEIINNLSNVLTNFKSLDQTMKLPLETPKIFAKSIDNFFVCTISNTYIQIDVPQNILNENDTDLIFDKLTNLIDKVGSFFENYIDRPFNYCGYTLKSQISESEINYKPLDLILNKQIKQNTNFELANSSIQNSFMIDNYYLNLALKAEKELKIKAKDQYTKPISSELNKEILTLEIDINDKNGFLNNINYTSQIEECLLLIQNTNNFYKNHALNYIIYNKLDYFIK